MIRVFLTIMLLLTSVVVVQAQERAKVLAVSPALAALAQEIAPKGVVVEYPGPKGENASDWQPDDAVLRRFQQADLVLLVGAGYAPWVATTALPRARLIDTSVGFSDKYIQQGSNIPDHQHGPKGAVDHHSNFANHFWFDLALAQRQSATIAEALSSLWPQNADEIATNLLNLTEQLAQLDADLADEFNLLGEANMIASHPVYQYLDEAYGLELRSFHWEPDQNPTAQEWVEFDAALATDVPNIMVWEAAPRPETYELLTQRGVQVIIISPSPTGDLEPHFRNRLGFPDQIGPATQH